MDVTLQRNGYNVERRKMYLENRNSLFIQLGIIYGALLNYFGNNLYKEIHQMILRGRNSNPTNSLNKVIIDLWRRKSKRN